MRSPVTKIYFVEVTYYDHVDHMFSVITMETDLKWNRFAYFVTSRRSVRFKNSEANFLF